MLNYESSNGQPIRGASFAVGVYTVLGSLVLQLQSDVAGSTLTTIPAVGSIRCKVPGCRCPPATTSSTSWARVGGTPADWVQRACELTVAEGDFFGSGRRLPDSHQTVLVDQEWGLAPLAGGPSRIDTQATA